MDWLKNRLSEPSSWAGIAAVLLGLLGVEDANGVFDAQFWGAVGVVVTALVAFFKKSPASKDANGDKPRSQQ